MPHYVDGFVIPISKRKLAAYRAMAKRACKVWLDHGALDYKECVGDDLAAPKGMGPGFLRGAKTKSGETVLFSWIVYKSKADRKRVLAAVMKDKRLTADMDPNNMPFDCKRMLYGGFKTIVEA